MTAVRPSTRPQRLLANSTTLFLNSLMRWRADLLTVDTQRPTLGRHRNEAVIIGFEPQRSARYWLASSDNNAVRLSADGAKPVTSSFRTTSITSSILAGCANPCPLLRFLERTRTFQRRPIDLTWSAMTPAEATGCQYVRQCSVPFVSHRQSPYDFAAVAAVQIVGTLDSCRYPRHETPGGAQGLARILVHEAIDG